MSTDRLLALARLWGAIEYFDPDVAQNAGVDWDDELVNVLPRVEAATSTAEYAAAVQQMLSSLNDPVTHVEPVARVPRARGTAFVRSSREGAAMLRLNDLPSLASSTSWSDTTVAAVVSAAAAGKGAIFDLRTSRPLARDEAMGLDAAISADAVAPLIRGKLTTPSSRAVVYHGFPSDTTDLYSAGFETKAGHSVFGSAEKAIPVALILNQHSDIPAAFLALIRQGRCAVVVDGTAPPIPAADTASVPLTEGLSASIRAADYDGGIDLAAASTRVGASAGAPDAAVAAALAALSSAPDRQTLPPSPMPTASLTAAQRRTPYVDGELPSEPYRLLAAFKMYTVIRYFFPYKPLMHDDWDGAFRAAIVDLRRVNTPLAYELAIKKFYAHIHDSHGLVIGPALARQFAASPPIVVRVLHGQPVITNFLDRRAASDEGAQLGDVVLAIDSEPVSKVIGRLRPFVPASTPQATLSIIFRWRAGFGALTGPEKSLVSLRVRTPAGALRTIVLRRSARYLKHPYNLGTGPLFRVLPGNLGYVDINRLKQEQVDGMFFALRKTRAMVLDDRGYPDDAAARDIGARLTGRSLVPFSLFEIPYVRRMESEDQTTAYVPTLESTYDRTPALRGKARYLRPAVVLIDDQTVSASEYNGMLMRAVDGAPFVGTPTAGQDGDVTRFSVPGRMVLYFSGGSVRWPDGRQTQRIGLQPDFTAQPTATDVRRGTDRVLLTGMRVAMLRAGATAARADRAVSEERAREALIYAASNVSTPAR